MTIINDWCPSCEESCRDHSTVCTVCGDSLQSRPPLPRAEPSFRMITVDDMSPENYVLHVRDLETSNHEIATLLGGLRERVSGIRQQVAEIRQRIADNNNINNILNDNNNDDLPNLAEIMDPQGASTRSRPTAQHALDALSRMVVKPNMSMMQQATLRVGNTTYEAVCGDFGPVPPIELRDMLLKLTKPPRTGKGGTIIMADIETKCQTLGSAGAIVYMERGDGISFVRKAMLAQEAGASGVIVGNNTGAVWPYTMKDSMNEETKLGLKIPVVMLKMSDGESLVKDCHDCSKPMLCSLSIQKAVKECIICVDHLNIGTTVVQLPGCGHIYHETCAMTWLMHHNSCPYCRRELPTDDDEYEAERRGSQRTQATTGSSSSTNNNGAAFYG